MLAIMDDNVHTILVDSIFRLYTGKDTYQAFSKICREHKVNIIEVGKDTFSTENSISVYYRTVTKGRRTSVTLKEIDQMYDYISRLYGREVDVLLYIDEGERDRRNLDLLLERKPRIILVKRFYQIARRLSTFLSVYDKARKYSVKFVSLVDGEFNCGDIDEYKSNSMKIALYDRPRSEKESEDQILLLQRMHTFVDLRTQWTTSDRYLDSYDKDERIQNLLEDSALYNAIFVESFCKLSSETRVFVKFLKRFDIPIISIKEGVVMSLNGKERK